ncbi:piggyBac transposable element-derived protein 4-like [Archocentrus centrarchus]|uniref:piggyBac transposable element-derived protein 4-like n=1 Tax=Archocentrus centrarchus TaxID=63155 RepID=UPI0011E9C120|nr:piggyBac transposable element-derived protein 4-like [Archocentrus centrarchus]
MSEEQFCPVINPPLMAGDGLETEGAAEGAASGEEGFPCDKEQPCPSGGDAQGHRERGRRGRGHVAAGGSSGTTRDRSRSPLKLRWRTEAEPDDGVPQPLRFIPKRTPGVQPPLNSGNPSPGEIFSHFFDSAVLKLLCDNTNKSAALGKEDGKKFNWTKINPEEMKKFIGLLIFMSVLRLPKMSDFWRRETIFHVPFPATIMARDRFMAILSNLHITDPKQDKINEAKRGTGDYDRLHWVRPLMEMISLRCKAVYHPRQHISVDERMVATKARLRFKQYMKFKPTKWGLKFFVLADINGYTINFQLYSGKSKMASGRGLSFDVVTSLVKKDYLGSGYIVYTNNFYTTPRLYRHLSQQGFGACGTYREGRSGVPTACKNALTKKSPRGSIRWLRDGDLLFVKWMDSREVSLCSTVHSVYSGDQVERYQKNEDGRTVQITIPRPTIVTEYNKYMGGVDTSDQLIGTNSVHRKTRRWPTTIFQHMVDIAMTNSFVIHKDQCATIQEKPMTHQCFEEELAAYLLGVPLKNEPKKTPGDKHFPVPTRTGQIKSQRASMGRRRCKICHRSTAWMCASCEVGLCLQPDRNCHWEYHQGSHSVNPLQTESP